MLNSNSIAITVSNDEPEDSNRMRVRVRKKRKKVRGHGDGKLSLLCTKFLLRNWLLVVVLLSVGILWFETSKVGEEVTTSVMESAEPVIPEGKVSLENLDRLDPTTRIVGGVKKRCLNLLPYEELQHLDIPLRDDLDGPVRSIMYISGTRSEKLVASTNFSQKETTSRFNLFTGYQSFEEREHSFKVDESKNIHCGFYNEGGGFRISEEDKTFMHNCKIVVATCAFGGGDNLYQPIGMTETSLTKVCYTAFWDNITLAVQESSGNKVSDDNFIGKWRIIVVQDLPFSDQRLNGKIPKMLGHRLFSQAQYSIWVDSKSQFRRDPLGVLEALLWRSKSVFSVSEHGARSSLYDEAIAVVRKHKATLEEVEVQLAQYRQDGMPLDKRLNGKKALNEASIIVREHTPTTNLFMCLWFNEAVRFTSRDQLSFPYVLWRLNEPKNINVFPVCTRKDMVNSMGHVRKPKPLSLTRSAYL